MSEEWVRKTLTGEIELTETGVVFTYKGMTAGKRQREASPVLIPYEAVVAVDYKAPTTALGGRLCLSTHFGVQPNSQNNVGYVAFKSSMPAKNRAVDAFAAEVLSRCPRVEGFTKPEYRGIFDQTQDPIPDGVELVRSAPSADTVVPAVPDGAVVDEVPSEEVVPSGVVVGQLLDLRGELIELRSELKFRQRGKVKSLRSDADKLSSRMRTYQALVDQAMSFRWRQDEEVTIFSFGGVSLYLPESTVTTTQQGRTNGSLFGGVSFGPVAVGASSGSNFRSRSTTRVGPDEFSLKSSGTLSVTTRGVTFTGGTRVISSSYQDIVEQQQFKQRVVFSDKKAQQVWAVSAANGSDPLYGVASELRNLARRVTAGRFLDEFKEERVREVAAQWGRNKLQEGEKQFDELNRQLRSVVAGSAD